MSTPLERFVQAAGIAYPKNSSKHTKIKCPAHPDNEASLTVKELSDMSIMLKCHAGCTTSAILGAVGLELKDLFPERTKQYAAQSIDIHYPYYSMKGDLLFRKIRKKNKKFFIEYTSDGGLTWGKGMHPSLAKSAAKPLYNMLQLASVRGTGTTVWVCEGEKDADALTSKGVIAVCNYDGASKEGEVSKWHPEYCPLFTGNDVIVVADNDDPGEAHARRVAQLLRTHAKSVRVVCSAHGKDAYDHLLGGGTLDTFKPRPDLEPVSGLPYKKLSDVQEEPIYWLWQNRWPIGGTTYFSGDGDEGKSFAILSIASALSTGSDIPEIGLLTGGRPRRILLLAQEDTAEQIIKPRFLMMGGDCEMLYHVGSLFSLDEVGQMLLEDTIKKLGIELVIADPLSNYYPRNVNPNSAHDVRPIIMACNQIAYRTHSCFLNLAHNNKSAESDVKHRLMGSADIRNAHRAGFAIQGDPDQPDTRYMFHVKANWSPVGKTPALSYTLSRANGFQWLGESDVKPGDLAARAKAMTPSGVASAAAELWLKQKLDSGKEVWVAETINEAEKMGWEPRHIFRAADKLGALRDTDPSTNRQLFYMETAFP